MHTTNQHHDATNNAGFAPAPAEAHQEAASQGNGVIAQASAELLARVEKMERDAAIGCGLSDVLWNSRCHAGYEDVLADTPSEQKADVEAFLRTRGYDPEGGEYAPAEGECSLTGIDENCCPCGRHE